CRDREVGAEHARVAKNAQLVDTAMQRGIATFRKPRFLREHLRHHGARADALHQEGAQIAVQRADEVLLAESKAGADDDRFLADAGVDAASDLDLFDERAESLVEGSDQLQPVEHLQQLIVVQFEFGSLYWRHRVGSGLAQSY